jgi:hypothetical protein
VTATAVDVGDVVVVISDTFRVWLRPPEAGPAKAPATMIHPAV